MKKAKSIDRQLAELEARGNDELELLNDLGPAAFPTADLVALKTEADRRLALHDFYQKRLVWLGAMGAGWFVLGLGFLAAGWPILGRICLFFMPFSLIAFVAGAILLSSRLRTRGHWLGLRDEILDELLRRQSRPAEKKPGPRR